MTCPIEVYPSESRSAGMAWNLKQIRNKVKKEVNEALRPPPDIHSCFTNISPVITAH